MAHLLNNAYLGQCLEQLSTCPFQPIPRGERPQWQPDGFGHCPLRYTKALQRRSFHGCLRTCRAAGQGRCRFAAFVDGDVLRRSGRQSGLCLLARICPELRTTIQGAVTYRAYRPSALRKKIPPVQPSKLLTLAVGKTFREAQPWHGRICVDQSGASLQLASCQKAKADLFLLIPHLQQSTVDTAAFQLHSALGGQLCEDQGQLLLKDNCSSDTWEMLSRHWSSLQRPHVDYEACGWLRLKKSQHSEPLYLVAIATSLRLLPLGRVNQSTQATCWAFGFQQPGHKVLIEPDSRPDFADLRLGSVRPAVAVWLPGASEGRLSISDVLLTSHPGAHMD